MAWARAKLGDRDSGSAEFRQALAEYASQGNKFICRSIKGCSRKSKPRAETRKPPWPGSTKRWRSRARPESIGSTPALHRIRGEILLKQNPADPAPAEAAFLAAIAVAQQQKARSFELRAALSLAKLYQSTGRPIDAHDVLGPALQGFSPTPEFPQIAEAIEFMAAIKAAG